MINRRMKTFIVHENVMAVDKYGNQSQQLNTIGEVDIALSFLSMNSQQQDIRYTEATHTGLTKSKDIKCNNIIECDSIKYVVLSVNNDTRLSQLIVKEVS